MNASMYLCCYICTTLSIWFISLRSVASNTSKKSSSYMPGYCFVKKHVEFSLHQSSLYHFRTASPNASIPRPLIPRLPIHSPHMSLHSHSILEKRSVRHSRRREKASDKSNYAFSVSRWGIVSYALQFHLILHTVWTFVFRTLTARQTGYFQHHHIPYKVHRCALMLSFRKSQRWLFCVWIAFAT